jgi:hypothetical protein
LEVVDLAFPHFNMLKSGSINDPGRQGASSASDVKMSGLIGPRPGKPSALSLLAWLALAIALAVASTAFAGSADPAEQRPPSPPLPVGPTNSFPDLNEVLQGRTFESAFDRDVFFLRRVRSDYPAYWAPLLGANIDVTDYVLAPEKMLRFVEELGIAVAGTDDVAAVTNLARIASNSIFYANTNGYRPRIVRAAAEALVRAGPVGREALAGAFNEGHYRADPISLEDLADAIGESGVADVNLTAALAAAAFALSTTNGGCYPRCTRAATRNLLRLPGGVALVRNHLNAKEVLNDPGRFQDVVDGILAARAAELSADLDTISIAIAEKLKALSNYPGAYRDDLAELQTRIRRASRQLRDHPLPAMGSGQGQFSNPNAGLRL